MYRVVAICLFLCMNFQLLPAQKLTGIWRGYFIQKNYNPFSGQFVEDRYKYEVQINELPNKALEGVTYSYKTTVFYGKAAFRGLYTPATKNLVIKETKMLEIKAGDYSVPCLMTCYLDYSKEGKLQTLSGTYSSMGEKDKTDCGSGMVYLEKVPESDFEPAPFLKQNPLVEKNKPDSPPAIASSEHVNIKKLQQALGITVDGNWGPKSKAALLKKIPDVNPAPDFNNNQQINALIQEIQQKNTISGNNTKPATPNLQQNKQRETTPVLPDTAQKPVVKTTPQSSVIPPELTERKNKMVKEIFVAAPDVKIDFYDNGVIDNDTITVYDDHQLVVNSGRLSEKPITVYLHLSKENPTHEIITVANNLGDVPPNTALMVVTAGNERHEIFITSDEGTNAKVLITYRPKTIRAEKY